MQTPILISALIAGSTLAAGVGLTAATADKMVAACFGYAKQHRGAVNVWVYDRNGEVIRFERMDGAPAVGSPRGTMPAGNNVTPFGAAIDPNALTPANAGDIAVREGNETIGRVRVAGMGATGDRACAEAAAAVR